MKRMSMTTAGILVGLLALVSWAIVVTEAWLLGAADLVSIGTAVLFTVTLAAWPYFAGVRVGKDGVRQLQLCQQCQNAMMLGIPFCIHCGAFPKVRSTAIPA